jgi:hypothetical protein
VALRALGVAGRQPLCVVCGVWPCLCGLWPCLHYCTTVLL